MFHVYNTMANSTKYVKYQAQGPKGVNVPERSVLINGGSGVARKGLATPLGVHTSVSDEDMEWLKENSVFKQHVANGYIRFEKRKVNPEVAAADMITHDRKTDACPIVPQDFSDKPIGKDFTAIVPKTNKAA